MRSLVVPCAGSKEINHIPIFLNKHPDGKLLAEKCLEGIFADSYDRIVFAVLKKVEYEFDAKKTLLSNISNRYKIEVVIIPEETRGPADTVFQAIQIAGIEGEFAVRDCLNSIEITKNMNGNFVSGLDLTTYNQDVFKVRTKSFIVTNEQNQILDIIEKKFRSDIISVGLYGFKNTNDFIEAYRNLSDTNYPIDKLYISNIISFLIGYGQRIFHCVPVNKHEDWGSIETWNYLQRKFATCIVDADKMIGEVLSEDSVDKLSESILKSGGYDISYVIMTVNNSINLEDVKQRLKENNIKCIGVVSGISHSVKKILVTDEDELQLAMSGI